MAQHHHEGHITRKDLKRDEFRETVIHGVEAVGSHARMVWMGVLVVVLVAGAIFGWRFYSQRQTVKAAAAFDEAMKVYEARIRPIGQAETAGEVTYVDEKNKYTDAAKKFEAVTRDYSRTRPGQLAGYWAALSYVQLGKNEEALKWLREFEATGNEDFAALARYKMAQVYAKQGKGEEAVKLYRQLIEKPAVAVPKPVAMLALANYYSAANPPEAVKLLNQVKDEFPNTAAARQAEQQLEQLPRT